MRSNDDQVRPGRRIQDRVDRRFVHDDGFDSVRRGSSGELRQVVSGGRLRRASLGFQPRDLLEGEVRRRFEPLGVQRTESCVEGRRHHPGDGQRAGRRVAEVHGHEHRLRRTLPQNHW